MPNFEQNLPSLNKENVVENIETKFSEYQTEARALENDLNNLADRKERRRMERGKNFFKRFSWLILLSGALIGGKLLKENLPASSQDKIMEMVYGVDIDESEYNTDGGEDLFSSEKVESQRTWLYNWIQQREIDDDGYAASVKEQSLDLLKNVVVVYQKGGHNAYVPYGDRRVQLNSNMDKDLMNIHVPLHELSHASTKSDILIGEFEKEVIAQVVKDKSAYLEVSKEFVKTHENQFLPSYKYVSSPEEFKSFLMVFRKVNNLKPNQIVDDVMIDQFYSDYKNSEVKDINILYLMSIIKDKVALKRALNELADNQKTAQADDFSSLA